jgi:hypothetical protein
MAIYYLVRSLASGPGYGIRRDTPRQAEDTAQSMADEYKTSYTVFKVTEQRQGSYHAKESG